MKFKLYKSVDYCEDSNTYMLIKDAILDSWNITYILWSTKSQLYRVRSHILTPKTKIGDILLYAAANKWSEEYFIDSIQRNLQSYFPTAKFIDWINCSDGFVINKTTTLLDLYDFLKNEPISGTINLEMHRAWVIKFSEEHNY